MVDDDPGEAKLRVYSVKGGGDGGSAGERDGLNVVVLGGAA